MAKLLFPLTVIFFVAVFYGCEPKRNTVSKVNFNEFEMTHEVDSIFRNAKRIKLSKTERAQCYTICQQFVLEKIHFPQSAVFANEFQFAAGDKVYAFLGFVETTNHLGVQVQHKFQVVMYYMGGDWWKEKSSWRCPEVIIRWSNGDLAK